MKDRIQQIMAKEGIQPTRFAEMVGVQRSSISHILSGRNKPSFDMIQGILKSFPKISADWLLLGKGEMYRTPVQGSLFTETANRVAENKFSDNIEVETSLPPIKPEKKSEAPENRVNENEVEQVVVFFKNKTFIAYKPNNDNS